MLVCRPIATLSEKDNLAQRMPFNSLGKVLPRNYLIVGDAADDYGKDVVMANHLNRYLPTSSCECHQIIAWLRVIQIPGVRYSRHGYSAVPRSSQAGGSNPRWPGACRVRAAIRAR